jgi:hypothetical protein
MMLAVESFQSHRVDGKAMYLIKFLVLILGVLTPPPSIDEPVKKIPLQNSVNAT